MYNIQAAAKASNCGIALLKYDELRNMNGAMDSAARTGEEVIKVNQFFSK